MSRSPSADPDQLVDSALDAWQASIAHQAASLTLTVGPMHGDYYRANLRCFGDRIIGIIDWDESATGPLMQEVAWAAWEFAKAPAGDDLQVERAQIFLAVYRDAGGPCREDEYAQAVPFIRLRLRDEIRRNLAAADRSEPWDRDYTEQEIRAFQRLRGVTLGL